MALALAGLAVPPDVRPVIAERERLAGRLRALELAPLPSHANFLYVPLDRADELADALLSVGLVVRPFHRAVRISVRTPEDDAVLVAALERALSA